MSDLQRLYDRARAVVAKRGFDADLQTRVALFVGATTAVNAAILAPAQFSATASTSLPFVHGQYVRELEFGALLARVTNWSANPVLYAEGAFLTSSLWAEFTKLGLQAAAPRLGGGFAALALGHALLGRVRLTPILPAEADEREPFVVALRRIEQENGRMIQTQIRLLKDASAGIDEHERERIVAAQQAAVDAIFMRFLRWIAGESVAFS
jgi:hypothetical protein